MKERIALLHNPRAFGKRLKYEKYGLWRYRVENYRIVCRINDNHIRYRFNGKQSDTPHSIS